MNQPSAVLTSADKDRKKYAMRDGCTHNTEYVKEKSIRIHTAPMPAICSYHQSRTSRIFRAESPSEDSMLAEYLHCDYYPRAFNFQYLISGAGPIPDSHYGYC